MFATHILLNRQSFQQMETYEVNKNVRDICQSTVAVKLFLQTYEETVLNEIEKKI